MMNTARSHMTFNDNGDPLPAPENTNNFDRLIAAVPQINHLVAIDRNGSDVFSNIGGSRGVRLSDRRYFRVQKSNENIGLFIDNPVVGRSTGTLLVPVSRRINGPDGRFDGVLMGVIYPKYFNEFYKAIEADKKISSALVSSDGSVFASSDHFIPEGEDGINPSIANTPFFKNITQSHSSGTYVGSLFDAQSTEFISFTHVAKTPYMIVSKISRSSVYSEWVEKAFFVGILVFAAIVGVFWTSKSAASMANLKEVADSELRKSHENLETMVVERTAKLAEASELNDTIFAGSSVGISIYDSSGQCISANASLVNIIGATTEQVLAQNFNEIKSWKESGLYDKAIECLTQEVRVRSEFNISSSFGKDSYLDCHLVPIRVNNQKHLLLMVNDMTETRQMQQQLIQSSKMATLGEMATGIAHEMSQPLNVIRMAVSNILRKVRKDNVDSDFLVNKLDRIEKQVERATEITDHMRIFGHKAEAELQLLDPLKVVASSLNLIGEELHMSNISVEINAPESCRSFMGYQVQIEQVLLNLLANSRDALRDVSEDGKFIIVSVADNDAGIKISVEDGGHGIVPNDLPRIFEPFYTTKEVGEGTGLGLSISYGIISDMGGMIEASNTDSGACFTITLPAFEDEARILRDASG